MQNLKSAMMAPFTHVRVRHLEGIEIWLAHFQMYCGELHLPLVNTIWWGFRNQVHTAVYAGVQTIIRERLDLVS